MNTEYLKKYFQNFPVTSSVLIINIIIFILNKSGQINPIVSTPGVINLQAFLANFSHYDLMHFIFNMLILWNISPLIEVKFHSSGFSRDSRSTGLGILIYGVVILTILALTTLGVARLSEYPTLGFSGIGLGLMVFAGLIYWKNREISKQLLGWAVANVFIGLLPGISFAGHFVGVMAGALVFGIIYIISPQVLK